MSSGVVRVDLGERSYDIHVAKKLSEKFSACLAPFVKGRRCLIVSDSHVFPLYGKLCCQSLLGAGSGAVGHYLFEAGEGSKNIRVWEEILHAAVREKLDRSSVILALGGGVVGDLAGFAAASYMRGIDFIQMPTSLLAMVDSSVGGKTGVDLPEGKNLVGAFWQPKLVLVDTDFLSTLPRRELTAGLAEVAKYGLSLDAKLFARIENSLEEVGGNDWAFYADLVSACCQLKADIVMADERESGLRAVLNFGHTFGHAIEAVTGYSAYIHGEAVGIGMVMAAELSQELGLIDEPTVRRVRGALAGLGLPVAAKGIKADAVHKAMGVDKKTVGGKLKFVVLHGIGGAKISHDASPQLVIEAIRRCCD